MSTDNTNNTATAPDMTPEGTDNLTATRQQLLHFSAGGHGNNTGHVDGLSESGVRISLDPRTGVITSVGRTAPKSIDYNLKEEIAGEHALDLTQHPGLKTLIFSQPGDGFHHR